MPVIKPRLSAHCSSRQPSAIRVASIKFAARQDQTEAINVAIGNVGLPMHPAMQQRMRDLGKPGHAFADGVVKYTATVGTDECRRAFLNAIEAGGFSTEGLYCQITDGGSQGMELCILATCGEAGGRERPLLLVDAAYTNYTAFASRLGRPTVSIRRTLGSDGKFALPTLAEIEQVIREHKPGALVVIPYDNPTGALYSRESLVELARLCVEHDLFIISDEAYRELFYTGAPTVSIWGIGEDEVPGISGRRVSIETASKVWNACGLRIGALVTDNLEFHTQCVAENTASLCSNAIGQHIFAALAELSHTELKQWFAQQRAYYKAMSQALTTRMRELLPEVLVSNPDASLYSVVDVAPMVTADFQALDFVLWCATEGSVDLDGRPFTLLTAPMAGFYSVPPGQPNPGRTQMRIAYVESPERMALVPDLFSQLLRAYLAR